MDFRTSKHQLADSMHIIFGVLVLLMLSICVCWKSVSSRQFLASPAVCIILFSKQSYIYNVDVCKLTMLIGAYLSTL